MKNPNMAPEYAAQLENVGRCMYSLDPHLCRWDDASEATKEKYRHKAHITRVWWQLAKGLPPTESVSPAFTSEAGSKNPPHKIASTEKTG